MRTLEDIQNMSNADYSCGIPAHYKPLAELVKSRGFKSGIEIGTAYGNNALYLKQYGDIEHLTCIDPYIFYPAMPGFICQEEYDILFSYANKRLTQAGINVIRTSSKDFVPFGLVDFVFIDADHEYESVKFDIDKFWIVVKDGGVLCGHDYNIFEGVNKAVDEFAQSIGKPVQVLHGNIWVINK